MVCTHLAALEQALIASGTLETYRGQAWSHNCREWVYFAVVLDIPALQQRFAFASCVQIHENADPRSGLERGFVCTACQDAVMGMVEGDVVFR
jgi:hypothetical protein